MHWLGKVQPDASFVGQGFCALANEHRDERWLFGVGAVAASAVWFTSLGFGARRLGRLFASARTWRILDAAIALTMFALAISLVVS